jgi:hypothetical protein
MITKKTALGLIVLGTIVLVFALTNFSIGTLVKPVNAMADEGYIASSKNANTKNFIQKTSGSMEEGNVLIELTPYIFHKNRLSIKFGMHTKTIDLDKFNLSKIITLEHEGKIFKPIIASKMSGHHSYGIFTFDVGTEISSFKIKINDIPKVQERIFKWNA